MGIGGVSDFTYTSEKIILNVIMSDERGALLIILIFWSFPTGSFSGRWQGCIV